jgi:hypothetical protein
MGGYDLHSLILAGDFCGDDIDRMWNWRKKHRHGLATMIGSRHAVSMPKLLRSPAIFEWFDIAGADDIPPVFVGEVARLMSVGEKG